MSTITYYTRSLRKDDSEICIWMRISHLSTSTRLTTGIKVPSKFWSRRRGQLKDVPYESEAVKMRINETSALLNELKQVVYCYIYDYRTIDTYALRSHIKKFMDSKLLNHALPDEITISQYIYLKTIAMEKRHFLNKGEPYSQNSINNWKKFMNVWESYEMNRYHRKLHFDEVTMDTYYTFMEFCDEYEYKKSTKYQYARIFKAVMNYALIEEVSSNKVHLNRNFATHASIEANKGIYLTMNEIFNLSVLELEPDSTLAKIRDLFLLGCYTGLRFSDCSSICANDIINFDVSGERYSALIIRQKKTKQEVAIPLLSDHAELILQRYGGIAPRVSISSFNKEIKHICKLAGITEKVKVTEIIGGREVCKWTTKDQLVSSHTARRSCITNLYLSGKLDSAQIKDISGHRSEQAFQRYICLSKEENVKSIFKRLAQK